jgi:hypothetical protein
MVLLTLVLYVPQWFLARTIPDRVNALTFVFDTLLFAGTLLVISSAIRMNDTVGRQIPGPIAPEEQGSGREARASGSSSIAVAPRHR